MGGNINIRILSPKKEPENRRTLSYARGLVYTYHAVIRLRDTDATGVIYFTEQMRLAVEAFEQFLMDRGFSLAKLIDVENFVIPIVHAEADYLVPLRVGDRVVIEIEIANIGESSFTTCFQLSTQENEIGKVSLVHVVVSKKTQKSIPIPAVLLSHLQAL